MLTRNLPVLFLAAAAAFPAAPLFADFIIKDPKACAEADSAQPVVFEEAPAVSVALGGGAGCVGHDDKGGTVRLWKYPHQYQRMAAAKTWKIVIEKGDGDRSTYVLPANSVVGVFFEQKAADGKWRVWRGPATRNPLALTQPPVVFNLDKVTSRGTGGLKQEYLIWDVMLVDALADAGGGAMTMPAGVQIRASSVWVWQGLNPIPKKVPLETGKAKLSFLAE